MTVRHRPGLLAGLLLPLAVVLAGVVGARPAAASTLTATHVSPQPPSCSTAVMVVVAVVVDVHPENRVKAISAVRGTRVGDVPSVSPARIRENGAAGTAIVVGATLVNLSDPTGHRYTTGIDSVDTGGSQACLVCSAYPTQAAAQPLAFQRLLLPTALAIDELRHAPSTLVPAPGPYVGSLDRLDADCAYTATGSVVCPNYLGSYVLTLQQYEQEGGYAPGDPRPATCDWTCIVVPVVAIAAAAACVEACPAALVVGGSYAAAGGGSVMAFISNLISSEEQDDGDLTDDGVGSLSQTIHGAERALDPSRLTPAEQSNVIANATQTFTQSDGAQVYVQAVGGRFNVVVQGANGVVTNLKGISQGALDRLAQNYGWQAN